MAFLKGKDSMIPYSDMSFLGPQQGSIFELYTAGYKQLLIEDA